jgi:hypothetical protein
MIDSKVMQTTSDDHDQIRKIIFRVPQNVFHDPRTFDPRNGMFYSNPNFGYFAIAFFLSGS